MSESCRLFQHTQIQRSPLRMYLHFDNGPWQVGKKKSLAGILPQNILNTQDWARQQADRQADTIYLKGEEWSCGFCVRVVCMFLVFFFFFFPGKGGYEDFDLIHLTADLKTWYVTSRENALAYFCCNSMYNNKRKLSNWLLLNYRWQKRWAWGVLLFWLTLSKVHRSFLLCLMRTWTGS